MRSILFFLFAFVILIDVQAQECGTVATDEQIEYMSSFKKIGKSFRVNSTLVEIPVQAHIVRNDDGTGGLTESQLNSAMSTLNGFYQNSNMKFELTSEINYIDNSDFYDFDASQEGAIGVSNDVNGVINVYFFNSLTSGGSNLCGYTYFPPSEDRIMMANGCTTGGNTFAHEFGHYFTLYHTHGKTNTGTTDELVDGSNCTSAGDNLCDTPADPNLSGNVNGSCQYTGTARDANNDLYSPIVADIMSYAPGSCRTLFTDGQYDRIRSGFESGRTYLNFTSEDFSVFFTANITEGCEGLQVRFTANSFGATSFEWSIPGAEPSSSSSSNPLITFPTPGKYSVTLTVENSSGEEASFTRTNYINIVDPLAGAISESVTYTFSESQINEELEVENPDKALSFELSEVDYEDMANSGSITVNNFAYKTEVPGNNDYLNFKTFDTKGVKGFNVSFDYSYSFLPARFEGTTFIPAIYDSLDLLIDTDCEEPPASIWKKGGNDLATVESVNDEFFPSSSDDWKSFNSYVPIDQGIEFAQFTFENISYGGNNLYIDNVIIEPDYSINPPSNLREDKLADVGISFKWDDNSSNELGFIIERSIDEQNFTVIDTVDSNVTGFSDISAASGSVSYRVKAFGAKDFESEYSNSYSVLITSFVKSIDTNELNNVIYPNPTEDVIKIRSNKSLRSYRIVNTYGQVVQSGELTNELTIIDVSAINEGMYLLLLETNKKQWLKHRVVKVK